jgi:Sec-independent protein secretion pathway component TatC
MPVLQGTNQVLEWRVLDDSDRPAEKGLPIQIVNLSPAGSFIVATKVAFYGGLVLASPFIFYFIAHFVFPALKCGRRNTSIAAWRFGGGLFARGFVSAISS